MEEEEKETKAALSDQTSKHQVSSFRQLTRVQQSFIARSTTTSSSTKTVSSGTLSTLTSSNINDQNTIQEQKFSKTPQSSSFRQFTSSSTPKSAINKSQGRLAHMLEYEAESEDSFKSVPNPDRRELSRGTTEVAEELSSSRLMQASKNSFVALAQDKQRYQSSSSQLLPSSAGQTSVKSAAESTVTMSTSQTKDVLAESQVTARAKSSKTYLSTSQEDCENTQKKRQLSRSLSPMFSASSDVSGNTLSPVRTLSTAKSVETSATGREGRQWLTASGSGSYRSETAKSMESLRSNSTASSASGTAAHHTHRHSFLTSSERDMRRVVASSVEARSLENLEKEMRLMGKRKAVSGEEIVAGVEESGVTTAEMRRGLYAGVISPGERRITVPQHLSLPPPTGGYLSLATAGPDRKLTILSPHSPQQTDILQFSSSMTALKTRRKKAIVLPRLVLPRSESDVFLE